MEKKKKLFYFIIIILILELFIFNYRFFLVQFSSLKKEEINVYQKDEKNIVEDKIYQRIEIPVNKKVESVKVNFSKVGNEDIEIQTQFMDEGEVYTLKNYNKINYNKDYKNSEYFVLNSQGNCKTIFLYLESEEDFEFENVEINTWYYEFNFFRVISIIIIGTVILFWKEINSYFEKNRKICIAIYVAVVLIGIIVFGFFCFKFSKTATRFVLEEPNGIYRLDPYNLLTESLLHGRIDLNYPYEDTLIGQEEIEKLSNLENTKDLSERFSKDIRYYFDTAFYEGKYYCYYGIVPVLTVMLPIAILTGEIVYSVVPVFVYGSVIIIMILLLYLEILKKLKIKLNFIFELLLYITLFLATGIPLLMSAPLFYQAADLSGLAWGMIGIYLLLKLDNNKKVLLKLFLAGLSFGLMVCSRPIFVLYFVIYVILAYKYIVNNKKINIKRLLYFTVPITIIAILQMVYNYVRFENIFEFGQFWQLTINDPSQQKLDIGMALNGIVVYLLGLPMIQPVFPYISALYIPVQNGNIIYCEEIFGLICYPFLWSMIVGWNLIKKDKTLKKIYISTIVISILSFAINTCLAGVNQRYTVDVQPCIAIMSFVLWMLYLKKYNMDGRSKKILCYLSVMTCIISTLIMFSKSTILLWFYEPLRIHEILGIESQIKNITYMIKHAVIFYK